MLYEKGYLINGYWNNNGLSEALHTYPAGAEFSSCPGDKPKSRLYATTALCCSLSAESAFAAYSRDFR